MEIIFGPSQSTYIPSILERKHGVINSLFLTSQSIGLSDNLIIAQIFQWDGFRADIRPGDEFSIVFESLPQRKKVGDGDILAAIVNQGKSFQALAHNAGWSPGLFYTRWKNMKAF